MTDTVYEILQQNPPLLSGNIQELLINEYNCTRVSARKRIERSIKSGKIERFIKVSNRGYVYYIKELHSKSDLYLYTLEYMKKYNCRTLWIKNIIDSNHIMSIGEIHRLLNVKYINYNDYYLSNTFDDVKNNKIKGIVDCLIKLGYKTHDKYILDNISYQKKEDIISTYEEKIEKEATVLPLIIQFIETYETNAQITNYRRYNTTKQILGKFDAIGKLGRRKIISVTVDCQMRRPVTLYDLYGLKERRGSSIGANIITKPVISYVVSTYFSDDCIEFAKENQIRLLIFDRRSVKTIVTGYETQSSQPKRGGRQANLQGTVFEHYIDDCFNNMGYQTTIGKKFYITHDKKISEKDTGTTLTDVDVFATKNEKEAILVECKSEKRQLHRNHILTIISKYDRIADYLRGNTSYSKIKIVMICRFNRFDAIDAKNISKYPAEITTPEEFWEKNKRYLKGIPRWLFFTDR